MFNQKRIEVNIGDVFVEYFHNKRKILSMMGLSKDLAPRTISVIQSDPIALFISNESSYVP